MKSSPGIRTLHPQLPSLLRRMAAVESWLRARVDWLAAVLVLLVAAVGLAYASATYINPDEGQHIGTAGGRTLVETLDRVRHSISHPPLLSLVVHLLLPLSREAWVLRLPSVLGVAAALWWSFRWLRQIADPTTAFAALAFLSFSPAILSASTEIRHYGLLLAFVAGTLVAMERMLARPGLLRVSLFSASLYLAIASDFTAAWITLALGLYVSQRLWHERAGVRLVAAWTASQVGAATLYALLYFYQLRSLHHDWAGVAVNAGWLKTWFHRADVETPLQFAWRTLAEVFAFCAGGPRLGIASALLFLAGMASLLLRHPVRDREPAPTAPPRDYAALLVLPLLIGCAGALLGLLPFGGSRHVSYLLPFVAAGTAFGASFVLRGKLTPLVLGTLLGLPLWLLHVSPTNNPAFMPRANLDASLAYLAEALPEGGLLLVDDQTWHVLRGHLDPWASPTSDDDLKVVQLGPHRVAARTTRWCLLPRSVAPYVSRNTRALGLGPRDPVWIMSVGWSCPPFDALLSPDAVLQRRRFGQIGIVQTSAALLSRGREKGPANTRDGAPARRSSAAQEAQGVHRATPEASLLMLE
jgi:Dolichyl-phosphate-mannose-protein mannosyltransferase